MTFMDNTISRAIPGIVATEHIDLTEKEIFTLEDDVTTEEYKEFFANQNIHRQSSIAESTYTPKKSIIGKNKKEHKIDKNRDDAYYERQYINDISTLRVCK